MKQHSTTIEQLQTTISTPSISSLDSTIKINVKNAEDPNLVVEMEMGEKIDTLKQRILVEKNKNGHRIRLVYGGKLLQDNQTVQEAKLTNNCFVICSITLPLEIHGETIATLPPINNQQQQLLQTPQINNNININTNNTNTNTNNNNNVYNNQIRNAIGVMIQNQLMVEQEERQRQQQRQLQQHAITIASENEMAEIRSSVFRDSAEFFFGVTFGMFLGPISLFILQKDYLSRNIKIGIILGVGLNILIGITRVTAGNQTTAVSATN